MTTSWTRVELTYAADTTGKYDNDNANSLQLNIWVHAGSTYNGGTFTSNTWAANTAANRVKSSNSSIFDSTSRTLFITGLQYEVGEKATPLSMNHSQVSGTNVNAIAPCTISVEVTYTQRTLFFSIIPLRASPVTLM